MHGLTVMDYRLLLFMHTPCGLKLDGSDTKNLIAPELDPFSLEAVKSAATSERARTFLDGNPDWIEKAFATLEISRKNGIRWVTVADEEYPPQWKSLSTHPLIFSYRGEPVWLKTPLLSVVGSRTPAQETLLWIQRELPDFFKDRDLGVVSGGARGIDQWAHRLAMDCGKPTVCILPSGLLNPYPFEREDLWKRIVDTGGAMVSTCGLNAPMLTHYFHIRNRWIAGLSPMCFVAEANRRSGSLITAKAARDENRTVCTLPVSPIAAQGLGNLDLIQEGSFFLRDSRDMATLWDGLNLISAGKTD